MYYQKIFFVLFFLPCLSFGQVSWTQLADTPFGKRYGMFYFSYDGKGYAGAGLDSANIVHNDFWEYNPSTDTWTQLDTIPGVRYSGVGMVIGSKAYAGLGNTNPSLNAMVNDWYEYDFSTSNWTPMANFTGTSRYTVIGFSNNLNGFVGTGYTPSLVQDFYKYDPVGNTWTQLVDFLGGSRQSAVGFTIGSEGFGGTGYSSGSLADWYSYNPATDTWTISTTLPDSSRYATLGLSSSTNGYLLGGKTNSGASNDLWKFTPGTTASWDSLEAFPGGGRYNLVGFVINDCVYAGLGAINSGTYKKDFYKYCTSCQNTSSYVNVNECDTYTSPSGMVITSSGTYSDTIPNSWGCDSVLTINLIINSVDTSVTSLPPVLTSNSAGSSYQWVSCPAMTSIPSAINQSFTPIVNGSYAVIVTHNGCIDTSSCYVVSKLGISPTPIEYLLVFPNPANDFLWINTSDQFIERVEILSIDGKNLIQKTNKSCKEQIDITELEAGIYFVKVYATSGIRISRVIIQ